jgi:hypothetical protein
MPFAPILPQRAAPGTKIGPRGLSLYDGRCVCFWYPGDQKDFLTERASCPDAQGTEWKKVLRISMAFVEKGRFPLNVEKFKKLEGQKTLFEIKAGKQLRLLGTFITKNTIFGVCLCVRKKRNEFRPEDIKKANNYISEMLCDWKQGENDEKRK